MSVRIASFEIKTACGGTHDKGQAAGSDRWFRGFDPGCDKCKRGSQIQRRGWKPARIHARWKPPGRRAYQPGEYDAGQIIVWTEDGAERIGTIWSAGPDPRTVWVSPDDAPRSFASMAVVRVPGKSDTEEPWAPGRWYQPDPAAMTTLAGRSEYGKAA
jgi:hypothetical protein